MCLDAPHMVSAKYSANLAALFKDQCVKTSLNYYVYDRTSLTRCP